MLDPFLCLPCSIRGANYRTVCHSHQSDAVHKPVGHTDQVSPLTNLPLQLILYAHTAAVVFYQTESTVTPHRAQAQ